MHFKSPLIKFCRSLSRFYLKKLWLLLSTYGHCTLCWGEFLWQDLRENDVIWQIFVHRHHFVCPRILVCPILRLHFILYPTAFTLLFWSQKQVRPGTTSFLYLELEIEFISGILYYFHKDVHLSLENIPLFSVLFLNFWSWFAKSCIYLPILI